MRKWLARKLFNLAARLDWEGAVEAARIIIEVEDFWRVVFAPKKIDDPAGREDIVCRPGWKLVPPKKKIGRPLGAKDKKPRKSYVRKVQS